MDRDSFATDSKNGDKSLTILKEIVKKVENKEENQSNEFYDGIIKDLVNVQYNASVQRLEFLDNYKKISDISDAIHESTDNKIEDLEEKFSTTKNSQDNRIITIENTVENCHSKIEKTEIKLKNEITEKFEIYVNKTIEDKIEIVKEIALFEQAHELWKRKSDRNRNIFILCCVTFVFTVGVFGWVAANYAGDFVRFVTDIKAETIKNEYASAVASIITFSIPIATVVWILRIVAGIGLLNINLAEDAKQRQMMVQTYGKLIAGDFAQSDQDRALILNAIFRPMANDSSQSDIQPPSITDLIGTAKPKNPTTGPSG